MIIENDNSFQNNNKLKALCLRDNCGLSVAYYCLQIISTLFIMPYKQVCRKKPTPEQFRMHAELRRRQAQINKEIMQQQKQAKADESAETLAQKNEESKRQQEDEDKIKRDADALGNQLMAISRQQLELQKVQLQTSDTSLQRESVEASRNPDATLSDGSSEVSCKRSVLFFLVYFPYFIVSLNLFLYFII